MLFKKLIIETYIFVELGFEKKIMKKTKTAYIQRKLRY